jgi:hypothetical protein
MSLLPPPEAIYPDPATAFTAIQAHARQHGYAVCRRDSRRNKEVYTCDRAGQYNPKGKSSQVHPSKQRNNTGSKKCGCLMRVVLQLDEVSNMWNLEVPHAAHNHSPSSAIIAHPAHRSAALSEYTRALISNLSSSGLPPAQILTILRKADPDIALTPKDIANLTYRERLDELNGKTPIQWLLEVRSYLLLRV